MWIKRLWNASELARTLWLVESTNNIKIKITHKVVGDGSKEYLSLIMLSVMMCLEENV